ncbi:hypothetical protein [Streptomyces sp. NPDC101455]|uniref:hypothetical protein n=1 Tax=Streptomyces sp. NPDC101455 TaxID=3366142 RepID=UPI0037FEB94D
MFFAVRAATTLVGGASFDTPGTGWRAVFQLAAVVILAMGIFRARNSRSCVGIVAALYTIAAIAELFHGSDLFGVIPVDHRDRVVHPLIVILAVGCLLIARRRPAPAAGAQHGKTSVSPQS